MSATTSVDPITLAVVRNYLTYPGDLVLSGHL